jgi:hypothetical protein
MFYRRSAGVERVGKREALPRRGPGYNPKSLRDKSCLRRLIRYFGVGSLRSPQPS